MSASADVKSENFEFVSVEFEGETLLVVDVEDGHEDEDVSVVSVLVSVDEDESVLVPVDEDESALL